MKSKYLKYEDTSAMVMAFMARIFIGMILTAKKALEDQTFP